ncbi:MAG: IS1 family transposase [Gemmatimonadaceae bacterium]
MNRLPLPKQAAILKALTEGVSIRATARMTGTSKSTILKLLVEVGEFCAVFQDHALRSLPCKRIQADELWAFVGAKARNAKTPGFGDVWTFVAVCADTKLNVSWLVGHRTSEHAVFFMRDVAARLANRVQLTTDGHGMYLTAVESAFGWNGVDFSQLVKRYGPVPESERRYSPPVCLGCTKTWVMGNPKEKDVSTSYVERVNLSVRMHSRRFTRLTNGFSKKVLNHAAAVALHFFVSNFCRSHMTLTKEAAGIHTSPAMAADLTDHVWTIEDMLGMMDGSRLIGS